MSQSENELYSRTFYEEQREGSARSAEVILPICFDLIHPKSIVDVGCGIGTWLAVARQLGISETLGLDGPHVDLTTLVIEPACFRAVNLMQPLPQIGNFDLALCLEVAEHLPETVGQRLVSELTRIAPAVLFSAAIPGQGGTGHINEQWQDYWAKSFADHAFVSLDCIRPVVWTNQRVDYWYAQNCLLMISRDVLSASKTLNNIVNNALPLPVVHPVAFRHSQAEIARLKNPGVLGWLAGGPRALNGTLRRRLRTTAQHNP